MSNQITAFYRKNKRISIDFSAGHLSSDGGIILLEKLERKHQLLKYFSKFLPDSRDPNKVLHSRFNQLKQRVFMLAAGYEDCYDVFHLKNDPVLKDILQGDLASQPTLSRFENSFDKRAIFEISYAMIDKYVARLSGRDEIILDIDSTDDPTHGSQQG